MTSDSTNTRILMSESYYGDVNNFLNKPPPIIIEDNDILKQIKQIENDKNIFLSKKNVKQSTNKIKNNKPPIVQSKIKNIINSRSNKGLNRIDMELVNQAFAYVDKISKDDDDDYELTENIDLESIDQKQSTSRLFKLKEKSEIDSLKSPGSQGISVYLPKSAPSIHGSDSKTKLLTNRLNNLLNYQTSTYIDTNRKSRAQEFDLSVNSESDKLSSTDFQNIIKNLETGSEVERLREELAKSEKSLANTLEIIKQLSDQKNL